MSHGESDRPLIPDTDTLLGSLTALGSDDAGPSSAQSGRGSHAASPPHRPVSPRTAPSPPSPRTVPSPPSPQIPLIPLLPASSFTPARRTLGPGTHHGPSNAISGATLQGEQDPGRFTPDVRAPHSAPSPSTFLEPRPPASSASTPGALPSRDGPADELVDPLLKSFASLNVQDGSRDSKGNWVSPPLWATLITKSASNPYFVLTVNSVKRCHGEIIQRAGQLEQTVVEERAEAIQLMTAALNVLFRAQGSIDREQPGIVLDHSRAEESIEDLETKLQKAQRDITTLHAEHLATPGLLEQMSLEVVSLQIQHKELGLRLQQTAESQGLLGEVTNRITALVEELRAQNASARRYTYPPRPSFTSETSADPPTSQSSTSSSRSQSFAQESPTQIEIAALQVEDASVRRRGELDSNPSSHPCSDGVLPPVKLDDPETAGSMTAAGAWRAFKDAITLNVGVGGFAATALDHLHTVALIALVWSFQILSLFWVFVPKPTAHILSFLVVLLLCCLLCGLAVVPRGPSNEIHPSGEARSSSDIDSPIWESFAPEQ